MEIDMPLRQYNAAEYADAGRAHEAAGRYHEAAFLFLDAANASDDPADREAFAAASERCAALVPRPLDAGTFDATRFEEVVRIAWNAVEAGDFDVEASFLAVSAGLWGRGETEADALAALRRVGWNGKANATLYRNERRRGEEPPYVDDVGTACYHGAMIKVADLPVVTRGAKRRR